MGRRKPNGGEDAPPPEMPNRSSKVSPSIDEDGDGNGGRKATDFISEIDKIRLRIFQEETWNAEAAAD